MGTGIITDPLVKPTQHSPRRVSIALRDKVKEKTGGLRRQTNRGKGQHTNRED